MTTTDKAMGTDAMNVDPLLDSLQELIRFTSRRVTKATLDEVSLSVAKLVTGSGPSPEGALCILAYALAGAVNAYIRVIAIVRAPEGSQ